MRPICSVMKHPAAHSCGLRVHILFHLRSLFTFPVLLCARDRLYRKICSYFSSILLGYFGLKIDF